MLKGIFCEDIRKFDSKAETNQITLYNLDENLV